MGGAVLSAGVLALAKPGIQRHPRDTQGLGDHPLGNTHRMVLSGQLRRGNPLGLQPRLEGFQTQTLLDELLHVARRHLSAGAPAGPPWLRTVVSTLRHVQHYTILSV